MDSDVLALVRRAERDLRTLLRDLEVPSDWEGRTRALVLLQAIAATLVEAARRQAETLSREAGQRQAGNLDRGAGQREAGTGAADDPPSSADR